VRGGGDKGRRKSLPQHRLGSGPAGRGFVANTGTFYTNFKQGQVVGVLVDGSKGTLDYFLAGPAPSLRPGASRPLISPPPTQGAADLRAHPEPCSGEHLGTVFANLPPGDIRPAASNGWQAHTICAARGESSRRKTPIANGTELCPFTAGGGLFCATWCCCMLTAADPRHVWPWSVSKG